MESIYLQCCCREIVVFAALPQTSAWADLVRTDAVVYRDSNNLKVHSVISVLLLNLFILQNAAFEKAAVHIIELRPK